MSSSVGGWECLCEGEEVAGQGGCAKGPHTCYLSVYFVCFPCLAEPGVYLLVGNWVNLTHVMAPVIVTLNITMVPSHTY